MRIDTIEVSGFQAAFKGMRNPKESWEKSDSKKRCFKSINSSETGTIFCDTCEFYINYKCAKDKIFVIGENDLKLAQTLIKAGTEHSKFMRMIHVSADANMPRYWWSEGDTYKFVEKNSCSTMHKLLNNSNPITMDLFVTCDEDKDVMTIVINRLEKLRQEYRSEKNYNCQTQLLVRAKRLLPEGFLQLRTIDTNYAELRNMYFQRKLHRLKVEWMDVFCSWVESLPYAEELICYE